MTTKHSVHTLYNINDTYSWSNNECNCDNTVPEIGLNENLVIFPPTTDTNSLMQFNIAPSDIRTVSNSSNPVIGVVKVAKSEKADIIIGNIPPNNSSVHLLNALGTMVQSNSNGERVLPSTENLQVNNIINQAATSNNGINQSITNPEASKDLVSAIMAHPEMEKAIEKTTKDLTAVIESGSKMNVITEQNTVTLNTIDNTVVKNSINKVIDEVLVSAVKQNISPSVEKSVISEQNGNVASVNVNNVVVSEQLKSAISEKITEQFMNHFSRKLPEHFSNGYKNTDSSIKLYDANNNNVNIKHLIHSNVIERFNNDKYASIYNSNNLVSNIVNSVENFSSVNDKPLNNIVASTSNVIPNGDSSIIKVATTTKGPDLNDKETSNAIATVVAGNLATKDISNVSVHTNPVDKKTVVVTVTVPNNSDHEYLANVVVDIVNKTSNVLENKLKQRSNRGRKLGLLHIVMVFVLLFIAYKLIQHYNPTLIETTTSTIKSYLE